MARHQQRTAIEILLSRVVAMLLGLVRTATSTLDSL
jgi:hypothetical protein